MKNVYLILMTIVILFFGGCGDSEDRVTGSKGEGSVDVMVFLDVGETKTFALNLNSSELYRVDLRSLKADNIIDYRVDYLDRLYPEVTVTGVKSGVEEFEVIAQTNSGKTKTAVIKATVNAIQNDTNNSIDEAMGSGSGGSSSGGSGENGGSGGSGGSENTPPGINPISDPNACNDNDPTWSKVGDSWGTPGGAWSNDTPDANNTTTHLVWIRSLISIEPSHIDIYYPRQRFEDFGANTYIVLGEYVYKLPNGRNLDFELQLASVLAGKHKYFYVKYGEDCFRGNIPSSIASPPDKTLTPVVSGTIF